MQRREFLMSTAALAGLAGVRPVGAQGATSATLARIAIMTLNFHALLKLPDQPASPERTLDVFDLPEMFADTYGVHHLEWQHYHLPSTELSYYQEVRARVDRARSRVSQVVVEFGGLNISAPPHNFLPRIQAVDLTKVWIDRCVVLGAPRIMVNQGQLTDENKHVAVETLTEMVAYGRSRGVRVTLETRGGGARGATPPPATPAWVLLNEVIRAGGAYSNIDLGGIGAPDQEALHTALAALLEVHSGSMHIKQSQNWDLATALRFITARGYDGLYSIEARGHDLTRQIYDAILANA